MKIRLHHGRNPITNFSTLRWDWYSQGRPYFNLWICLDGEAEMTLNHEKIEVFPGVGVLLKPQDQVSGQKTVPGTLSNVGLHFLPRKPVDEVGLIAHSSQAIHLRHFPLIREMAGYIDYLLMQIHEDRWQQAQRMGGEMVSVFLRDLEAGPELPVDRLIRKQAEAMRVHPERSRSGQELAAEVGLSFSQFSRRFQRLYEMPSHDFLIEQRINKACSQLRETQMTVGEIADSLGYRDVGYFSRQFKQKTGRSPLAYRKKVLDTD